ncbi:FAD-dependent oxidoreductase, partial [Escherichia coli]|uniref:FAD-dependent oxidoreductase n=1 Tax=Escherichia coli TaxID=562 RepID=UPI002023B275
DDEGHEIHWDKLVLATGSYPFVPPIPGNDLAGCFVYRTLDDLDRIAAHAAAAKSGVVIGGGLLGLEAANALQNLPYDIKWAEFPAAAPLAEALNAGAVDAGIIGDAP